MKNNKLPSTQIYLSQEDREFIKSVQIGEMKKHMLKRPRTMADIAVDVFRSGKVPFINNRNLDI